MHDSRKARSIARITTLLASEQRAEDRVDTKVFFGFELRDACSRIPFLRQRKCRKSSHGEVDSSASSRRFVPGRASGGDFEAASAGAA